MTPNSNIKGNTENLCVLIEHLNGSRQSISILDPSCVLHHFWTYFVMLNITKWLFTTNKRGLSVFENIDANFVLSISGKNIPLFFSFEIQPNINSQKI